MKVIAGICIASFSILTVAAITACAAPKYLSPVALAIDKSGKTDQLKVDQPNNDFWFYELDLRRSK